VRYGRAERVEERTNYDQEGYPPRNRAERVIAGRLFMALLLAVALWIVPTEPGLCEPLVRVRALGYLAPRRGMAPRPSPGLQESPSNWGR